MKKLMILVAILLTQGLVFAKDTIKPNIIFILMDDMGYADLGCFGSKKNRTPVADKMAEEGMRFTSFYTHPVCGPSRTAILTGSYAMRVAESQNKKGHHPNVHPREILIPQVLKPAGYVSACIGKWDLNGHKKDYRTKVIPSDFGFDYSYGRPGGCKGELFENGKQTEQVPLAQLTKSYTDRSLQFIEDNKDNVFFLYLAHAMPHEPLDATPPFKGKSANGIYGDVIEELDWNVGRLLNKVKELGLDEKTIVIFTSDNGPWTPWTGPEFSGDAGPLRGYKCETWDGGVRTPFIVRSPGIVPAGTVCNGMIGDVDMLPTLAAFAGEEIPKDRIIDGKNLKPLMTGKVTETPVKERYYYYDSHLQAVRSGKWKLILQRSNEAPWLHDKGLAKNYRGRDLEAIPVTQLYDMENDIGESMDVALQHPEVVDRLLKVAQTAREDVGDYNQIGNGARFYDKGNKRPDMKPQKKKE